jgi:uncharacterized membrane protein YphA (DoxX/SURF4 family)
MTGLVRLGQVLLGVGMIALGSRGIAYADFLMEWTQVPEHLPAHAAFAYLHGIVLVAAGLAFVLGKIIRPAAVALGAVWLLWTLLCIPLVIATWRGRSGLEAELLGMTCGVFTLAALVSPIHRQLVLVCRYAFALCLLVYGMVHFIFPAGVASWVPTWIPGPPLFWAYFTGVAHCAAGVALLTGVRARLATKLFAIMLSSWVLILHIPRVAAAPHDRHEWLTLFIALSLSGVAWIMAGSLELVHEKRIF